MKMTSSVYYITIQKSPNTTFVNVITSKVTLKYYCWVILIINSYTENYWLAVVHKYASITPVCLPHDNFVLCFSIYKWKKPYFARATKGRLVQMSMTQLPLSHYLSKLQYAEHGAYYQKSEKILTFFGFYSATISPYALKKHRQHAIK